MSSNKSCQKCGRTVLTSAQSLIADIPLRHRLMALSPGLWHASHPGSHDQEWPSLHSAITHCIKALCEAATKSGFGKKASGILKELARLIFIILSLPIVVGVKLFRSLRRMIARPLTGLTGVQRLALQRQWVSTDWEWVGTEYCPNCSSLVDCNKGGKPIDSWELYESEKKCGRHTPRWRWKWLRRGIIAGILLLLVGGVYCAARYSEVLLQPYKDTIRNLRTVAIVSTFNKKMEHFDIRFLPESLSADQMRDIDIFAAAVFDRCPTVNSISFWLEYGYDSSGNQKKISLPNPLVVKRGHNSDNDNGIGR